MNWNRSAQKTTRESRCCAPSDNSFGRKLCEDCVVSIESIEYLYLCRGAYAENKIGREWVVIMWWLSVSSSGGPRLCFIAHGTLCFYKLPCCFRSLARVLHFIETTTTTKAATAAAVIKSTEKKIYTRFWIRLLWMCMQTSDGYWSWGSVFV